MLIDILVMTNGDNLHQFLKKLGRETTVSFGVTLAAKRKGSLAARHRTITASYRQK